MKMTEVDFEALVDRAMRDPPLVDSIIGRCPSIIDGDSFKNQMRRFLPADIHEQTLDRDRHREALAGSITGLYAELKQRLFDDTNDNDSGGAPAGMAPV